MTAYRWWPRQTPHCIRSPRHVPTECTAACRVCMALDWCSPCFWWTFANWRRCRNRSVLSCSRRAPDGDAIARKCWAPDTGFRRAPATSRRFCQSPECSPSKWFAIWCCCASYPAPTTKCSSSNATWRCTPAAASRLTRGPRATDSECRWQCTAARLLRRRRRSSTAVRWWWVWAALVPVSGCSYCCKAFACHSLESRETE